jgi:hypothetical protein
MSAPTDTQAAANNIELGPIIGETGTHPSDIIAKSTDHAANDGQEHGQSSQDGDEIASDEKTGDVSRVVGDEPKSTSGELIQAGMPSQSPHLSPQRTRSGVETVDRREKQSSEQKDSNAMLNLPPPLPFDLKVSNLWVGVPHSGPSRYVPLACQQILGANE